MSTYSFGEFMADGDAYFVEAMTSYPVSPSRSVGRDVLSLILVSAKDVKRLQEINKRISELENYHDVEKFRKLDAKSEFKQTVDEINAISRLKSRPSVAELLELESEKDSIVHKKKGVTAADASLQAPAGEYRLGDIIPADVARQMPSFKDRTKKKAKM